jgi:hypothetical protein
MDLDPYFVGRPLNLDPGDASLKEPPFQEFSYFVILQHKITVFSSGKPS